MTRDRIIQIVSLVIVVFGLGASGRLLPSILAKSEENVLRYTNVSVEGAPPFVAIGTAIGAVRGLIVDYLWIKIHLMKDKGLFYEVMADAEMITKLQPRFAAVWAFHGHNMAYNISVATHTLEERWEWVNAGIRLVRNEGLRYNPNNIQLHRELAFWFSHKIEGVADDAHLYYKRELCREWHMVLGEPPVEHDARTAWMKNIADAPNTIEAAIRKTPSVRDLLERLRQPIEPGDKEYNIKLDRSFLEQFQMWKEITEKSAAAQVLGIEEEYRKNFKSFVNFDAIADDPMFEGAWDTLLSHLRKRVLTDEYNMDPQLMYEYTRDLGPIDWRHGQAHALYWARRGSHFGEHRIAEDDIYIVLNTDAAQCHAMQDLARWGRISFDPFSTDPPGRFPDPRWIDAIDSSFEPMYLKHYDVRGAGGERFITFLQNFMASAICEWYRSGETARAQNLMDRLDSLFGSGLTATTLYKQDLRVFVNNEIQTAYQEQPHTAPRDVAASLRYGFKVGILGGRPDVLLESFRSAQHITKWFKENSWNNYVNKFGVGRIADIIGNLEDSAEIAYLQLMTDPSLSLENRMALWANTDSIETRATGQSPVFRALVFDRVMPFLANQFAQHELSTKMTLEEAFPKPPGLEQARTFLVQRQQRREQEKQEQQARDSIERR